MSLPPHDPLLNTRRTGYTRRGFAEQYHAHRPKPPSALVDFLLQLAGTHRPGLVVDLGSGTGISTTIWAAHAERVVGIEPLDEMRKIAQEGHTAPNASFRAGVAQRTGIPDGAAAKRRVGFACTVGIVLPVLDLGLADEELGLIALRDVAERTLGAEGLPWYVSYRVRVGVK
jgi:SAM-dependent methyltransferase